MKHKYYVEDLQGGSFCEFTQEEPLTLKELRDLFWGFAWSDGMTDDPEGGIKRKDLTLDFIRDFWEVAIYKVKGTQNVKCN